MTVVAGVIFGGAASAACHKTRLMLDRGELAAVDTRPKREVLNCFAGLRYVEKHAKKKTIRHEDIFESHRLLADAVMKPGGTSSATREPCRNPRRFGNPDRMTDLPPLPSLRVSSRESTPRKRRMGM